MGRPAEKGAGLGWAARDLGAFGAWAKEKGGSRVAGRWSPGAPNAFLNYEKKKQNRIFKTLCSLRHAQSAVTAAQKGNNLLLLLFC